MTPSTPLESRSLSDHIEQNVESIAALQRREMESVSSSQRRVGRVSQALDRPGYLVGILVFSALWVAGNLMALRIGWHPVDPAPFVMLDGILTLTSVVTATIVLMVQNREARLEKLRAHLELQVSMLTEQKVTKLIHLIEELRNDLPMVRDRHDPQAAVLQESADAAKVMSVIESAVTSVPADEPSDAKKEAQRPP